MSLVPIRDTFLFSRVYQFAYPALDLDWSRYEGSIQNTYQGEILWTDGNCSYGVGTSFLNLFHFRFPYIPFLFSRASEYDGLPGGAEGPQHTDGKCGSGRS